MVGIAKRCSYSGYFFDKTFVSTQQTSDKFYYFTDIKTTFTMYGISWAGYFCFIIIIMVMVPVSRYTYTGMTYCAYIVFAGIQLFTAINGLFILYWNNYFN